MAPVKYGRGVLAPNGIIYGIPLSIDSVLRIKIGLPTLPNWMLQSHFNKFQSLSLSLDSESLSKDLFKFSISFLISSFFN